MAEKKQTAEAKTENKASDNHPEFMIQRIYTKDVSFETPNSPSIFRDEWKPAVNLDINTKSDKLQDHAFEVVLGITTTVKLGDKTAFLAEVKQAGIFTVKDFPEDQLQHMLGSFCPNILYPYAREAVTDLVGRGGFPQLYLSPVNFEAVYQQQLQQQAEEAKKH